MDSGFKESRSCRRPTVVCVVENLLEDRVPTAVGERRGIAVPREGCSDHDPDHLVAVECGELKLGKRRR